MSPNGIGQLLTRTGPPVVVSADYVQSSRRFVMSHLVAGGFPSGRTDVGHERSPTHAANALGD